MNAKEKPERYKGKVLQRGSKNWKDIKETYYKGEGSIAS